MIFSRRNTRRCFEIVADTNIIFSAILYKHGNPRRLFTLAEERNVNITVLDHSVEELTEIFSRKGLDIRRGTSFLRTYHNIKTRAVGDVSDNVSYMARDLVAVVGDRPIFAYVYERIAGGVDCYLVTGDKGMLKAPVKAALNGRVFTVSDFIQLWDDFKFVC